MTASPRSLAWSPISGSLDQVFKCKKPGQHTSPHQAAGRSKDQHLLGHLRTHCADHFGTNSELVSGQLPASRSQVCLRHSPPVSPSRRLACKTSGHSEMPE